MMALLQVDRLCAWYGRAQVLFDVGLQVKAGEVVALIGDNGAGKSTTLKAIMGLVRRRAQQLRLGEHDLAGLEPFQIARLGVGYVPEDRRIFGDLTVLENLEVGRQSFREHAPRWTLQRLFELFPVLEQARHRSGGMLSGGEQQMLTLARTLMGNPNLILMDEPSEGMAPVIVETLLNLIAELKQQGIGILLSEQNEDLARQVGDRAYLLQKGQIAPLDSNEDSDHGSGPDPV